MELLRALWPGRYAQRLDVRVAQQEPDEEPVEGLTDAARMARLRELAVEVMRRTGVTPEPS